VVCVLTEHLWWWCKSGLSAGSKKEMWMWVEKRHCLAWGNRWTTRRQRTGTRPVPANSPVYTHIP